MATETMTAPAISTVKMTFLAENERYHEMKPVVFVPPAQPRPMPGNPPAVKRDARSDVKVESVRAFKDQLGLDKQGFEVMDHKTAYPELDTEEKCQEYKMENQEALKKHLNAVEVITWGLKQRVPKERKEKNWNYRSLVETESPALMAHCDFTWERGQTMVEQFLGKEKLQEYIDKGYRVRNINTWRPLLPVIENQPLAFADKTTVDLKNLISCDRVLIDDVGEMTLLQYKPEQKWYWLESQTRDEPFIFATWDSKQNGESRHCPHVSFEPESVRSDAPPRWSVETRSVVVTKD